MSQLEKVQQDHTAIRAQEFMRQTGYYVLPKIFDDKQIRALKTAAKKEYFIRNPQINCDADRSIAFKLYKAAQTIPEVMDFAKNEDLLKWLEIFIGPNILLTLNRHNHVSTNSPGGSPDPLHRDHGEWTRGLLTAIIYGDDATIENGCTHIIPGSQNIFTYGHPVGSGYWLSDMPSEIAALESQALPVPVKKGAVLLFDAHMFHGAGVNTSNADRFSLALGYHAVDQLTHNLEPNSHTLVRGGNIYRGN